MMPSGWEWVIAAVAVLCLFCAAMAAYHTAYAQQVLTALARRQLPHRKDCACPPCWETYVQRLRDVAARQAAEINQQEKQR